MLKDCLAPFIGWGRFSCVIAFLFALSIDVSAQTSTGKPCAVQIAVLSEEGAGYASLPWDSLAQYLSETVPGCTFEAIPLSRDQITASVRDNAIDYVIVDPILNIQLKSAYRLESVATLQSGLKRDNYSLSGGTLFYLNDGRLTGPQDLKQKTIAFADKDSLAGRIAVLRELRDAGLNPHLDVKSDVVGSGEKVIAAVLNGQADAGCLRAGELERLAAEQKIDRNKVRVIKFGDDRDPDPWMSIPVDVSTRLYPDSSWVACPRAAPDLTKQIAVVLLAMTNGTAGIVGRPHLAGWTFPRSDVAVHECMKELGIPPYEDFGEITFAEVSRKYRSWLIAAGALMIMMLTVTIYVIAVSPAPWRAIVERNRAETALHASVARFEHIISCSADWIWETDSLDRFSYSNSMVEQMLGYKADEIIGKCHFDLLATAEKERVMALGQKKFGTGARIFRERFRLLTKDGRVVIQETTAEPIINSSGQFAGYRGVNRDITNQVRFVRLRP